MGRRIPSGIASASTVTVTPSKSILEGSPVVVHIFYCEPINRGHGHPRCQPRNGPSLGMESANRSIPGQFGTGIVGAHFGYEDEPLRHGRGGPAVAGQDTQIGAFNRRGSQPS